MSVERIMDMVIGGYLCIAAISDLRNKKVAVRWMLVCAILFVPLGAARILQEENFLISQLMGAALGGLFLLLGYLTKEAVGYADGWSMVLIGLYLGAGAVLFITCVSLMASAVFAGALLFLRKAGRKSTFPFLPFLAGAYLLWCLPVF